MRVVQVMTKRSIARVTWTPGARLEEVSRLVEAAESAMRALLASGKGQEEEAATVCDSEAAPHPCR